mmetsp:Transcript_62/g.170  ORF Transcript_62/g.170 Transcript_62/m.170 type:complete len:341 (+) Transcript_62:1130-2152(+)
MGHVAGHALGGHQLVRQVRVLLLLSGQFLHQDVDAVLRAPRCVSHGGFGVGGLARLCTQLLHGLLLLLQLLLQLSYALLSGADGGLLLLQGFVQLGNLFLRRLQRLFGLCIVLLGRVEARCELLDPLGGRVLVDLGLLHGRIQPLRHLPDPLRHVSLDCRGLLCHVGEPVGRLLHAILHNLVAAVSILLRLRDLLDLRGEALDLTGLITRLCVRLPQRLGAVRGLLHRLCEVFPQPDNLLLGVLHFLPPLFGILLGRDRLLLRSHHVVLERLPVPVRLLLLLVGLIHKLQCFLFDDVPLLVGLKAGIPGSLGDLSLRSVILLVGLHGSLQRLRKPTQLVV